MNKPTPKKEELKIRIGGNILWLEELLEQIGNVEIGRVDNGEGQAETVIDLVEIIDDLQEIEEDI